MKKLFSFLGTTPYLECHYEYGEVATASRFVQTAIVELFCQDFSPEDQVVIFLTPQAKEKNWYDSVDNEGKLLEGLESAFKRIAPELNVKLVSISEEQNEKNLWDLFERVSREIQVGDEIVFDITHGFRSLPIMALTILNHARFLKKATMRQTVYGAFEALGYALDVKKLGVSERIAPIIDLTPMVTLMDWTNGIDHFLRSGDASIIQELTEDQVREIYKQTPESRSSDQSRMMKSVQKAVGHHRRLADQLDVLTKSLQTCRGPLLTQAVTGLNENLRQVKGIDVLSLRPLVLLLDEIEQRVEHFSGDPIMVGYEAAEWCLDHGLIQQGFTFLQEGLFTAICHVYGMDVMKKENRDLVSSALTIVNQHIPEREWKVKEGQFSQLKNLVAFLEPYRDYFEWYGGLVDYRNSINHAGYNQPIPAKNFAPKLKETLNASHPFFIGLSRLAKGQLGKQDGLTEKHATGTKNNTSCKVGLSNKHMDKPRAPVQMFLLFSHQLTKDQEQEARRRFGVKSISHLPVILQQIWSTISPDGELDTNQLQPIQKWLQSQGKADDVVLVQGEYGATMYMVAWLRAHGFRPVYATSQRDVEENVRSDGTVETKRRFRHVQFREYPQV